MKKTKKCKKNLKASRYRRLRNRWLSFNFFKRWTTVGITLLITYTLIGFFAVPAIVKSVLTTQLTQQLGRVVSIEKVYWNPFSLVFELEKFNILDAKKEKVTFSLDRLHFNLETASLYKWSLVVKQVEIDHPQLNIRRVGMKSFSFDDIIKLIQEKVEAAQSTPKVENEEPSFLSKLRFEIADIAIHRGMFFFNDEFAMKNHSLTDFEFVIPSISNFKNEIDEYIQPQISGKINGSAFGGESHLKPFKATRESVAQLKFKDLDLSFLTKYLPEFVNLELVSCLVDSDLSLIFEVDKSAKPYLSLQGGFSIRKVDISLASDSIFGSKHESIFRLDRFTMDFGTANLLAQQVSVKKIEIIKPYVNIRRHTTGLFNVQNSWDEKLLAVFMAELELAEKKVSESKITLDLKIEHFVISGGILRFTDSHDARNFKSTVDKFDSSMHNFSTINAQPAVLELSLNGSNGLNIQSNAKLYFSAKKAEIQVNIAGVDLTHYAPYYQPFLNVKLNSGILSLTSNLTVSVQDQLDLILSDSHLGLSNFLLSGATGNDLVAFPKINVKLKNFSLKNKTIALSSIEVEGGGVNLIRSKDAEFNLAKVVKLDKLEAFIKESTKNKSKPKLTKKTQPTEMFNFSIEKIRLNSFGFAFVDQALKEESDLVIFPINMAIDHISSDKTQPIDLKLHLMVNKNSEVKLEAKLFADQQKISADLEVNHLHLPLLNPYLAEVSKLNIPEGMLHVNSKLNIDYSDFKKPKVETTSTCSIDQFGLKVSESTHRLVSGKQIKVSDIKLSNSPLKVEIRKVLLDQVSSTVILEANNQPLVETAPQKEKTETKPKAAKSLTKTIEQYINIVKSYNLSIAETEAKDGSFYFKDSTVKPNYEIKVIKTDLVLSRIATKEAKACSFKMTANTDDRSELQITGVVNPFKQPFSMAFTANASVDDLSRFTPYSGKYVGYEINKGKSKLALDYKIENNIITASNDVFINQFSFGNDVDSDEATSLPVRFALAIITDKHGNLELKLPVSGDLNDPDFSISGAIITVTKNILTNIVTAPFSFLSSLYGGTEDIKTVNYRSGSSELTEPELKKIEVLTKILQDRPGLKVEITAYASKDVDYPAILENKLTKLIQECWYIQLSESDQMKIQPNGIKVDVSKTEQYFEMVEQAYEVADFEKERNFLNMIKSQTLEFMLAKLKAHLKVAEQELYNLAVDRGQVINGYLLSKGITPSVIFLTEPKLNDSETKTSATINLK